MLLKVINPLKIKGEAVRPHFQIVVSKYVPGEDPKHKTLAIIPDDPRDMEHTPDTIMDQMVSNLRFDTSHNQIEKEPYVFQ